MSRLQQSLDEYLRIRRAFGFKLEREGRCLLRFLDFLEHHGSDHITTPLAIRWAMASPSGSAPSAHTRLRMVRGFAQYLASHDPRTELPPYEQLPAVSTKRPTPYIYTENEIGDLMASARSLRGLKGPTYATLLGLLAATGMRVGEAIGLDRGDVDWRRKSLIVHQDKRQPNDPANSSCIPPASRPSERMPLNVIAACRIHPARASSSRSSVLG